MSEQKATTVHVLMVHWDDHNGDESYPIGVYDSLQLTKDSAQVYEDSQDTEEFVSLEWLDHDGGPFAYGAECGYSIFTFTLSTLSPQPEGYGDFNFTGIALPA